MINFLSQYELFLDFFFKYLLGTSRSFYVNLCRENLRNFLKKSFFVIQVWLTKMRKILPKNAASPGRLRLPKSRLFCRWIAQRLADVGPYGISGLPGCLATAFKGFIIWVFISPCSCVVDIKARHHVTRVSMFNCLFHGFRSIQYGWIFHDKMRIVYLKLIF